MGNARRHSRHRAQRLCEIGLGQTVEDGCVEGRRHADRMTRGAIAAFVRRVRRIIMRAQSIMVVRAVIAAHICMMVLRALRAVIVPAVVVDDARARMRRLRCAKRHGRGRVALKGHRKHHEPQQDCAEMEHRRNCRGVVWPWLFTLHQRPEAIAPATASEQAPGG